MRPKESIPFGRKVPFGNMRAFFEKSCPLESKENVREEIVWQ